MTARRAVVLLSEKSSGSTALLEALCRLDGVGTVRWTQHQEHETLYWWKAATVLGAPQPRLRFSRLPIAPARARAELEDLLAHHDALPPGYLPPAQFVDAGWTGLADACGPVFVEKSPHHLHHRGALGLLGGAAGRIDGLEQRHVGLLRHPMAVLHSMWRRWRIDPAVAQWEWARAARNLRWFRAEVDPDLVAVRYEDLCADPGAFARLGASLDLTVPDGFDTGLRTTSVDRWRDDGAFAFAPAAEVVALAADLGYDCGPSRSPTAAWRITRTRAGATWTVRRARRRLTRPAPVPARPRLLCVSHTAAVAGAPTSLLLLLEHGLAGRYDVTVLFGEDGPMVDRARALGVAVRITDGRAPVGARLRAAAGAVAAARPDVVAPNCVVPLSREVAFAARVRGLPVVWTQREDPAGARTTKLMPWVRRLATRIVAVSKPIRAAYGHDPRVRYIPNGVDTATFAPTVDTGALRRELGVAAGERVVTYVGALQPLKGVDLLLEVAEPLLADRPGLHLVLIGDGELRAAADAVAARIPGRRLHVLGVRRDAAAAMALADVVVLPSLIEAFPRVVLEAAGCGTPVVATDVGDTGVVVRPGVTGWCIPSGDVPALRAALTEALDTEPAVLEAMGAAGRALVAAEYSIEATVAATAAVLDEVRSGARR